MACQIAEVTSVYTVSHMITLCTSLIIDPCVVSLYCIIPDLSLCPGVSIIIRLFPFVLPFNLNIFVGQALVVATASSGLLW